MSWSDLSTKLKKNVAGRLDLMSRHALRSTCRSNRYLVNDMDFFIPRVRVSVKDSAILIMIHTGIDKFLRIEMWIGPHRKTIIRKSQNVYDANHAIQKVLPSIPRFYVARVLCSLLSHEKLLIGTMEWEFDGDAIDTLKVLRDWEYNLRRIHFQPESKTAVKNWINKIHSFVDFLQKYFRKSHVFRANQLMTTNNMIFETAELLRKMYDPSDLKKIERINVLLSKESLTPLYSFDTYLPLRVGRIRRCAENICHEYDERSPGFLEKFVDLSLLSVGFGVLRFAKFDDFARQIWDRVRKPVTVFTDNLHMKVELAGSFKGHLTLFHMRSPCGYWIYMVLDSRRKDFDAYNILKRQRRDMGRMRGRSSEDIQKMWGFGDVVVVVRKDIKDSEDYEDVAAPDEFMKQKSDRTFQKLVICITSFAFLSCALYAIFYH
ncbi:hypothetical protein CRE_15667 [Caenorhabditis remanei]|uniref:F-box domain-containing protein n=1 Tax=Caenorhabditis remanei TaxID=31234 RepID=E3N882_CAERE|nr:hypothetical protein CRE_15667 [Caenorhabditis remanei]